MRSNMKKNEEQYWFWHWVYQRHQKYPKMIEKDAHDQIRACQLEVHEANKKESCMGWASLQAHTPNLWHTKSFSVSRINLMKAYRFGVQNNLPMLLMHALQWKKKWTRLHCVVFDQILRERQIHLSGFELIALRLGGCCLSARQWVTTVSQGVECTARFEEFELKNYTYVLRYTSIRRIISPSHNTAIYSLSYDVS